MKAVSIERQLPFSRHAEEIIASTLRDLENQAINPTDPFDRVRLAAKKLCDILNLRLNEISDKINLGFSKSDQMREKNYNSFFTMAKDLAERRNRLKYELLKVAEQFNYQPDISHYHSLASLVIQTEIEFHIYITVHGYGTFKNGVMAASAFTMGTERQENGAVDLNLLSPYSDLFQFNYAEPIESTEQRFRDWLESALAIALAEWRRLTVG